LKSLRPLALLLAALLIAGACGRGSSLVGGIAEEGPAGILLAAAPAPSKAAVARPAPARPAPPATPRGTEPPIAPPQTSSLVLEGDMTVNDPSPDVFAVPSTSTATGEHASLRIEVRHRVGGSSQPDAVVVFLGVPAKAGTYALHAPTESMLDGRVYAFVSTRGEAVGSMKEFSSDVAGSLTLRREAGGLSGSFRITAQEPPPTPRTTASGQPAPPTVGTIPPEPPGRIAATGTLMLRADEIDAATLPSAKLPDVPSQRG
jgi:hypothetical protein